MAKKLGSHLFYGSIVRIITESYIIALMSAMININSLDFSLEDGWACANTVITLITLAILTLYPIVAVVFMFSNWAKLSRR